jgi:predicted HTH transcriptional regulator
VAAFANFDGGHIIIGARDPRSSTTIVLDDDLPCNKGKQGLKEWLETKIYRLSDPPVRNFDVKEFSLAGGNLAVIEIRTSDDAPIRI